MQPYGGFWWRVLAYIIDSIVLNIAISIIGSVLGLSAGVGVALWGGDEAGLMTLATLISVLLSLVLSWLYFALMESSSMQGTLGKLAVGCIVTDLDGNRIGFGRASVRYFGKILSAALFLIGYIMVAFTARKQGLHDLMAGTLVWKTRDPRTVVSHEEIFR